MKPNWQVVLAAAAFLTVSAARPVHADALYDITIDTSSFSGPLSVFFQLTDGNAAVSNTASVSLLDFGGGQAEGAALFEGTAAGDASGGFTLSDTVFFTSVQQGFSSGSTLSFRLGLTTLFEDGTIPDAFAFSILDSAGIPLETADLLGGTFFTIDLSGERPAVSTYGATVTEVGLVPVPEPATMTLMASAMATAACGLIRRRRRGGSVTPSGEAAP